MNEDELRAAMQAHNGDAPHAAEFAPRPVHRRPALPIAAAIVVTAAIVSAIALVWSRSHQDAPGALATRSASPAPTSHSSAAAPPQPGLGCPVYLSQLPRSIGVDRGSRLAPAGDPNAGLVCSYQPRAGHRRLISASPIKAGLVAMAADLALSPRLNPAMLTMSCPAATSTTGPIYLLGLRYRGRRVWIELRELPCFATATNGVFISPANTLVFDAGEAASTGMWPIRRAGNTSCGFGTDGRFGRQAVMVPSGSTSVTICRRSARGHLSRVTVSAVGTLVSALNSSATHPGQDCRGRPLGATYSLFFHYALGPDAEVDVKRYCSPPIENGALQSGGASAVVPLIQGLLRLHS